MSDAIFNATTAGAALFGIPTYSAIINDYNGSKLITTDYYICINNDPAVLSAGPDTSDPNFATNWKHVGRVKIEYVGTSKKIDKIWREI